MKPADHFLSLWQLSQPDQIAETPTSNVYKIQRDGVTCILKIYTDLGRSCESDAPYFFTTCKGYSVANVIEFNEDAMLIEYIDGTVLKQFISEDKDEEATNIIAATLKAIHAAPQKYTHTFETLERRFLALFTHAEKDCPDIVKRAATFAKEMLAKQSDIRLLHGDMHHENVMQKADGTWVAIDPQPLIGDRAYDCANTLHNPHQTPALTENIDRLLGQAEILGKTLDIPSQKIIDFAFIHGCLSACWSEDDKTDTFSRSLAIRTSEVLEPHTSKGKK